MQRPPETEARGTSKSEAVECKRELLRCDEINPPASEMVPQVLVFCKDRSGRPYARLGTGHRFELSFPAGRRWNGLNWFMSGSTRYRGLIARGLAISIVVVAVSFLLGKALYLRVPQIGDWLTQDGQPLTLLEGISVWPTIFLRVAALALCVWLIGYSRRYLDRNLDEIVKDFHLKKTWKRVTGRAGRDRQQSWAVGRACGPFLVSVRDRRSASARGVASSFQSVSSGWGTYVYQGSLSSRMWRVTAAIVAMLLFWATLLLIFGQPHAPIRGHLSLYAYEWVTFFHCLCDVVPGLLCCGHDASVLGARKGFSQAAASSGRPRHSRNTAIGLDSSISPATGPDASSAASTTGLPSSSSPSAPNASPPCCIGRF